jgi:hypothetical protein
LNCDLVTLLSCTVSFESYSKLPQTFAIGGGAATAAESSKEQRI